MSQKNIFEELIFKGTLFAGLGAIIAGWLDKRNNPEAYAEAEQRADELSGKEGGDKKSVTEDIDQGIIEEGKEAIKSDGIYVPENSENNRPPEQPKEKDDLSFPPR